MMKKKVISLLLCIIICLGLCIPALGYNDDVTVSAVLDQTELEYDADNAQTVKLTVSLSKEVELFSLYLESDVPSELKLSGIEGGSSSIYLEEGEQFSLETGIVSWYKSSNKTAKDLVVLTVTVPAGTPAKSYKIGVKTIKLATSGQNDDKNWMNGASAYATLNINGPEPVTYTVTYSANGGSGSMKSASVTEGDKLTLPECGFTAPDGQMFDKWDAGKPGDQISITGDKTIKAIWKDIPAVTYTVTYSANGGSGSMKSATVTEGDKLTLPDCSFTAPEGQKFKAWSVGGKEYAAGKSISITADTTVAAIWADAYTVSFDANGGSGSMADETVIAGDYTLPENGFTAPEGKEYKSWSIDGVEYNEGDVYKVESDVTVITLWQDAAAKTFTVSFNANGGSGSMASKTVTEGDKLTLPECGYTAPSGKQFKAWIVDGKEYAPGDKIEITADTTVKAVWEDAKTEPAVIAAVCFHLQGGSATGLKDGDIVEYTEDEVGNSLPSKVTRSGYVFDGWYDKKSGGTQYKKVSKSLPSDLYAHWSKEDTITVTFRLIGAKLADEDVDLSVKRYLPDYVTWIATTTYEMEEGSTVYDLWVKATEAAGIKSDGAERGYVSSVTAPKSLGGYELEETANGDRGGWMYTINGKHPDVGLKDQNLKDGDEVVWHYVNDYLYEVEDWPGSLGSSTYFSRWLKAPDRVGGAGGGLQPSSGGGGSSGGGSGGGSSGGDKKDENKASDTENTPDVKDDTVTVTPEVENGEAKASVEEKAVSEALENCEDDILTVKVDTKDADSVELTLSAESVKAVSDADADLHIETENGTVKLDADTLSELAESGKEVTVTVQANEDGTTKLTVTVDGKPADVTMKVELPAAEDGQVLVAVLEDGTEEIIKKSVVEDGKVYAELPAGATVKVIENEKSFDDVKDSDWFADAVDFASSHELFKGVSDAEFAPKLTMTRAMLVTVLYRLEDEPDAAGNISFDDVPDNTWYTDAVAWAAESGIVQGTGDGFDPDANVTREQIATILYRYAQKIGLDTSAKGDVSKFSDGAKVSSWASDAMAWAVSVGLFKGDDTNSLNPQGDATRAEVATLLERLVKLIVM